MAISTIDRDVAEIELVPASGTRRGRRHIWRRIATKIIEVAAILTLVFAYLQVALGAGWPPFDPSALIKIEQVPDGYQVGNADLSLHLTGRLAKPYKHVWLVAQDETGLWFPISEAYTRQESGSWDARIRREQFGNVKGVDLTLHAVLTDDQGSTDLSVSRNARKGLVSLPLMTASSDHRLIHT